MLLRCQQLTACTAKREPEATALKCMLSSSGFMFRLGNYSSSTSKHASLGSVLAHQVFPAGSAPPLSLSWGPFLLPSLASCRRKPVSLGFMLCCHETVPLPQHRTLSLLGSREGAVAHAEKDEQLNRCRGCNSSYYGYYCIII